METKQYDIVVIGAGSGGLTSAVGFSKVGKKVLLVEREHMGGECTNSGCIPSKALLHHAKSYYSATKIAGESTKGEAFRAVAFKYVREQIDAVLKEETPKAFEKMGIDVVIGEAEFNTRCSIQVGEQVYEYKKAIIATGSSPRLLKVEDLEQKDVLTNQNIFELDDVPEKLLIIGSGPIGMEMGQAFAMLGSKVTIATIDSRFARLEDKSISPIIQKKFEDLGVEIHLNAFIKKVENGEAIFDIKNADGNITEEKQVEFDKVLIAIGRVPNMPKSLDVAGIKSENYGIVVDSQYRTSNRYVYALGDVAQRLKFTHTADDVARQVIMHVLSKGWMRVKKKAVPKVTYTQPEIAQVGLSYDAACEKFGDIEVMKVEVPYGVNDRANTDSNTGGLMVVVARRINGAVLGANIIGNSAGEMISVFTIAIDKKISMWGLRSIIYAYPTYSLLIKKAGDYFFARQIGDLKKDLFNLAKKHAPKIIAATVWLIAIMQFYAWKNANAMDTSKLALMVFDFVSMTVWGTAIYIFVYTVRPLTFFPATALTILSGVFFGFWEGFILTVIAANISAIMAYFVGRFFGKGLKLEDSFIGNWVMALRKNPFASVLTMRLIFLPFDGVSYFAGILKIQLFPFSLATILGTLLGIATFVSIGASISIEEFKTNGFSTDVIDAKFLGLSAFIFVASLLLSRFLKRWHADVS